MNYWDDGLSNEQYHKDKEHVSSSSLKLLIEESPDVFYESFVLGNGKRSSDSMNLSTLVHHGILEGEDFVNRYVVKPKFDMRKNDDRLACEKWVKANAGKVVVTEDELKVVQGTYRSVMKHPDAFALLKDCIFERSGYYTDLETDIKCRIRYDAYDPRDKVLIDIKAVRSVKKTDFQYAIKDYRWDLSMAMYGQGIFAIDDEPPEQYIFIAVEKTAPYRCAVYELGHRSLEAGRNDYFKALSILKECRASNTYPSIQSHYETLDLPIRFLEEKNV